MFCEIRSYNRMCLIFAATCEPQKESLMFGCGGSLPSRDAAAARTPPLFGGKSGRTAGQASSWCAGRAACERRGSSHGQSSARVASPEATCLGGRGQRGTAPSLAPPAAPGRPIGSSARCSRGAIGEAGLHMQMTWKLRKHVDTRIGFISAAGRKVKPGLAFQSTGMSSS